MRILSCTEAICKWLKDIPRTNLILYLRAVILERTMRRITQFFRLLKINIILMRYTFTPDIVGSRYPLLHFLALMNPWRLASKKSRSRGESIRFALESL